AAETGKCPVILVDDVLTTGATAAHSVLVLASLGVRADLVLVFANA
ncbi:MAG TPA: ComF family protein, partial [Actinomycetales bacterium]|nr:ComF family protein [Actinomycetales bacterium]